MTVIHYRKPTNLSFNKKVNGISAPSTSLYTEESKKTAPVNIKENKESFLIEIIAPGFSKEDLEISVEKDVLTVKGEKKDKDIQENVKIRLREYDFNNFTRSFHVGENVDGDSISASFVNGVLTLNLGKKDAVKQPKKEITIA